MMLSTAAIVFATQHQGEYRLKQNVWSIELNLIAKSINIATLYEFMTSYAPTWTHTCHANEQKINTIKFDFKNICDFMYTGYFL